MDLLKTILVYLTMVFVSSVQSAPDASLMPTPTPTASPVATAVVASVSATPVPTPSPTPVPTPAITPNSAYRTVQMGDKGEPVTLLQRRLAELGYYSGEIDGVYGNQTRRAVERFQYYQGLSADGIAGKRTQTVLYESEDVVLAPVDVTPTPTAGASGVPAAAITPPPATATPQPTFVPAPSAAPSATAQTAESASPAATTPTAAPLASADAATQPTAKAADAEALAPEAETAAPQPTAAPSPQPLPEQVFVLAGSEQPLTLAPAEGETQAEPVVLHPLQYADSVYVPLLAILGDAGIVTVPQTLDSRYEVAFSLGQELFQIGYALDEAGMPTDLTALKNLEPQPLTLRSALLLEGVLYLPLTVVQELTGITFTADDTGAVYTVALPGLA